MGLDWENKKGTYIACIILGLILIYSLIMTAIQKKEENSIVLKGEKTLGHYKVLKSEGPTPFKVDLLEVETNKTLKDVFISETCPDYQSINASKSFVLFRYTNLSTRTMEKTYTYEGLYEAICTKIKKEYNEDGKLVNM